jgi:CHAD domain-containing protein
VARRRAIVRARTLRAAIRDAAGLYLPDRLHEVRLAVKKLRYALEAVAELQRRRPSKALLTLKQAQDLLGRMHDFEVLIARTRAVQGAAKVSTLRESSALDQMVRHLEHACRQMHADYVAQRTALLDVCDHAEQRAAANQDKRARKAARGKDATHRKKG